MADMQSMGLGKLGAPDIIIKRKFRWTLKITTPVGDIPEHFVKIAAKPQLEIEETEINFLNATTWIPGKGKWQPIAISYIDTTHVEMKSLYDWITTIYDFTDPINLKNSEKSGWNGTALLTMYDGCGSTVERWLLQSCWPQSINFGDLDYGNSEEAIIELTLRYSDVKYEGVCGPNPTPQCMGC